MEGNAREYGSETKKQRDHVQGNIRDMLAQQVDSVGHTLDLSKGVQKGEALIRATTHMATVENEVRQFNQQVKETPTPVGSTGWDKTFAMNGFPNSAGLISNARSQYMGDTRTSGVGVLHTLLKGKR